MHTKILSATRLAAVPRLAIGFLAVLSVNDLNPLQNGMALDDEI